MQKLVDLVIKNRLLEKSQKELDGLKSPDAKDFASDDAVLYVRSLYRKDNVFYGIGRIGLEKRLCLFSEKKFTSAFPGSVHEIEGVFVQETPLNWENAKSLWKLFPFTMPVSLRDKRTTVGCGDRLGLATKGHIHAVRKYDAYPVFAQQSIRELNLTNRTYPLVVKDATFLVFEEGFERGYGADGDHLKHMEDIDVALDAQMPMITLDLTEVMNPDPASWDQTKVDAEFLKLDEKVQRHVLESYAGRSFDIEGQTISLSDLEAKRCALMYLRALDFSREVDQHLRKRRGDQYDLEISIDETTAPTLPSHHLFIIRELQRRDVHVNSLAPRFIGEFQKGIDYIGDLGEFEQQFIVHCKIAKAHGMYKISIHSGSDKFSVYPAIGKHTAKRVHLKTAGTSWLEAVRTIARVNPSLYRKMHKKAFDYFPDALKFYHITADLSTIPDIDSVPDDRLEDYLNKNDSRQLLHVTYGGLLNDREIREPFFRTLGEHENEHAEIVATHMDRHIRLLGIEKV